MNLCGFGVLTEGAGNRVWVKRANGRGDVYQYDPTDQLTNVLYEATNPDATPSVWTNEVRYVFDAAGNRTSVTATNTGTTSYTANALNQYTAVGGVALGWDANGNPTNVVENGVTLSLTYDRENRLTRVDTGTVTVTNTYDAFHRLVERATGAGKLRFVYDNRWRVIAEYDGNDALVNKYVYGPEIDEPVRLMRSGSRFYYHAAALGTVTELTGFLGNVRETYTYDVYGQPTLRNNVGTVITASQFGNRFLFQGRDRDPDTGLYNFRYRNYSPTLGRFLQTDPLLRPSFTHLNKIEFSQVRNGIIEPYVFVQNSPFVKTDPTGLCCWTWTSFQPSTDPVANSTCNYRCYYDGLWKSGLLTYGHAVDQVTTTVCLFFIGVTVRKTSVYTHCQCYTVGGWGGSWM
jgi:RHS repeat-associated protein